LFARRVLELEAEMEELDERLASVEPRRCPYCRRVISEDSESCCSCRGRVAELKDEVERLRALCRDELTKAGQEMGDYEEASDEKHLG